MLDIISKMCFFLSVIALALAQQLQQGDEENFQSSNSQEDQELQILDLTPAEEDPPAFSFNKDFAYNIELQNNLIDKWAELDLDGAFNHFFNFTGVATTPLGRVSAWFGDLVYPVILLSLTLFGGVILIQTVFHIFGLGFNTKFSFLNNLLNGLSQAHTAFLKKISGLNNNNGLGEVALNFGGQSSANDDGRVRRQTGFLSQKKILRLLKTVYQAIEKYDANQKL